MLDTIALTLNQTEYEIMEPDAFSPSASGLLKPPYYSLGGRGNFPCYQNPTKAELKQGIYKPRLTLTKRKAHVGYSVTLRIEFSAPKLVFGNNFDELVETDFERVLDILHGKLAGMGIRVHKDVLRKADVSAIHYSKNIPLTNYSTCAMVLAELRKINLNQRLDLSHTDYRNEGHAVRYHANSHEIAFYDKLRDLKQSKISEKRAIESDNIVQADLFSKGSYQKQLEVLRMEVRLGNRTKLKAMLKALKIDKPLDFESLFSASLSQKMLRHFWERITLDMPVLALSKFKPEDVYHALVTESKGKAKPAKLLQQIGTLAVINNVGLRGLHSLVSSHSNPRTWQRMKKELEGKDVAASMKYAATQNVQRCLEAFKPVKVRDYALS